MARPPAHARTHHHTPGPHTLTSRRYGPMSWPSSPSTTSPSTSRRCSGERPSRPSAKLGKLTPQHSRSTRTTSSRDHTGNPSLTEVASLAAARRRKDRRLHPLPHLLIERGRGHLGVHSDLRRLGEGVAVVSELCLRQGPGADGDLHRGLEPALVHIELDTGIVVREA